MFLSFTIIGDFIFSPFTVSKLILIYKQGQRQKISNEIFYHSNLTKFLNIISNKSMIITCHFHQRERQKAANTQDGQNREKYLQMVEMLDKINCSHL